MTSHASARISRRSAGALREDARLSGQCGLGAETAGRARPDDARLRDGYANVHRGLHYLANAATEAYEAARETCRAFINAPSSEEVIFTKNATEAYNLVASSLGRHLAIGEGDEILLSIMEHHSNIVPWHFWREQHGAVIKWAPVDEDGNFLLEEFEKLVTPRTKVISITMMSNALGTIVPVKEVCAIARKHGIPVLVDGAQAAVHLDIDVQDIGCDFFVMTGHKLYGPSGIGVLWGRKALLDAMPPFLGGGEMIRTVTEETVTYNEAPHRFEAGTPPLVQAFGPWRCARLHQWHRQAGDPRA